MSHGRRITFALTLVSLLAFATSAHARTIYWDGIENPDGWDAMRNPPYSPFDAVIWSFFDVDREVWPNRNGFWAYAGIYCLEFGCGGRYSEDTTLISDTVPLPAESDISVGLQMLFVEEYNIEMLEGSTLSFGLQEPGQDNQTLIGNFFPPLDAFENDFEFVDISTKVPLPDDIDEAKFWWRLQYSDLEWPGGAFRLYITNVCLLGDCPTRIEVSNHADQQDGFYRVGENFALIDGFEAVSCMPAREVPGYLRGVKASWYQDVPENIRDLSTGALVVYRSDNEPGEPPGPDARVWNSPLFDIDRQLQTAERDFVCGEIALDEIGPDENLCVGIYGDSFIRQTWAPVYIPYEDVGFGNSQSYVRNFDPSGDNEIGEWVWMKEKEFLFSATLDVGCTDPTTTSTTTTVTTTSSSSSTTTTAVATTSTTSTTVTSGTTTTSSTTTSTIESPTTTTTANPTTSTTTSTTVPADTAASDDDDDDNGCGS
ncbi:MAG: hypothetical protein H6684_14745 [Deltaproteobacteria bacterium]|nr:hypothetical protein [Deltaproteobacteria bacterium]